MSNMEFDKITEFVLEGKKYMGSRTEALQQDFSQAYPGQAVVPADTHRGDQDLCVGY